ncbi:hypothetical protein [Novosphingobium huizhouense]|uniref:hypothetical protein n=1 Tax=Novosphingobium huizhouense TaxID=2866625 RepID=UPI001CD87518|nr:hypothetical protein [Novosphingobium huizhouense]
MSERLEMLRQAARAEAALREQQLRQARKLSNTPRSERGVADVGYGETACPRCGARSGFGCKHREPGDTRAKLSSFERRRSL